MSDSSQHHYLSKSGLRMFHEVEMTDLHKVILGDPGAVLSGDTKQPEQQNRSKRKFTRTSERVPWISRMLASD